MMPSCPASVSKLRFRNSATNSLEETPRCRSSPATDGPLPEGRVGEAPPFVGQGLAVRACRICSIRPCSVDSGIAASARLSDAMSESVPPGTMSAGESMIRLIPITDEFEQDVVLSPASR